MENGPVPGNESNATVVRAIADQLFETWQLKQQQYEKKRNLWLGSLPAWMALVLSALALLWNAAVISARVGDNTRRIDQLEVDRRQEIVDSKESAAALARIESKVDLMREQVTSPRKP